MKRSVAVILTTLVLVLAFLVFFLQLGEGADKKTIFESLTADNQLQSTGNASDVPKGTRVVELTVKNWEFDPPTIIIQHDQKVILRATSVDVPHSFVIERLGKEIELEPFKTQEITVQVPAIGRYAITCTKNCGPPGFTGMTGMIVAK